MMMTPATRRLATGVASFALGLGAAVFSMLTWYLDQGVLSYLGASGGLLVLYFYAGELLAIAMMLIGVYLALRASLLQGSLAQGASVVSIIAQTMRSGRLLKGGVVVTLLYGLLYALTSSTLVYQPGVDFGQAYGAVQPGWVYLVCCGSAGSIPKLILYVAPAAHVGIQLVPLSLLLLFVVPPLVGVNSILSYDALKSGARVSRARWSAATGAIVGLFTACPTCAGLFLAGSLGGIGVVAATALAPYQVLFVLVSIPVLLVSPVLTALTMKRSHEADCAIR